MALKESQKIWNNVMFCFCGSCPFKECLVNAYDWCILCNISYLIITSCIVACHILECSEGLAQEVISTIGQAFELRFKQYLKNPPKLVTPHDRWERLCACSNKYCKHLHLCQCVYTCVCTLFNDGTSLGSLETPLISCTSVYSMRMLSFETQWHCVYLHSVLTSHTEKHLITEYFLPYF